MGSPLLHDRYAVESPIGRGRATVYRGTDTRLGRAVALKQVPLTSGHETGERARQRALREARAAARLADPNVVTVYDVVEEDDALWLVMELVEAPSLARLVADRGPLDHHQAAAIGLAVLRALSAAHDVGIVHRDVKPANVLVPDDGPAKLADFGVATVRDESRLTATGLVIGSPAYMAPEQARGEDVGPAADLWSLGATLYYAYEGEPPFDGGSALATATAVVHGEPRAEQRHGALSPLVARLLAKTPDARPSAAEARQELRALAEAGGDVAATRPLTATALAPVPVPAELPEPEPEPVHEQVPLHRGPGARRGPGRRRSALAWILVVAALLAALGIVLAFDPDDLLSDSDGGGGQVEDTTTAPPSTTADEGGDPATTVAPNPEDQGNQGNGEGNEGEGNGNQGNGEGEGNGNEGRDEQGQAPNGWRTYTHPDAGYTLAYPPGWQVEPAGGPRVDFRDPESGSYLRVDWTDEPNDDPVADWEEQSRGFAASHEGYEEIAIEPYAYRDYEAARWEFRYTDGGARLHAFNLNFIAGDKAYALFFQTKEEQWQASQDTWAQLRESFQP